MLIQYEKKQRYPRYFLYGVIQKTNNFICLHTSPLLLYDLYLNKQYHRVTKILLKFEQMQDIQKCTHCTAYH